MKRYLCYIYEIGRGSLIAFLSFVLLKIEKVNKNPRSIPEKTSEKLSWYPFSESRSLDFQNWNKNNGSGL